MYYMKNELKLSRIVNYMDDIMIIHHDKEYLMFFLEEIKFTIFEYSLFDSSIFVIALPIFKFHKKSRHCRDFLKYLSF